ncbi:MAG: D-alanine--D-alanine ligase [Deltaproteobacteria bacterium]|nr:MAG: D-alanine--D-alanine ligase [Deltaproteobacteria bacterium]
MTDRSGFAGKRIGVFYGGVSAEREVSLRTGAAAVGALRRKGYDVREIDIREDWLGTVRDAGVDAAFLALHGRYGEDGCIQAACELARLPYTGSGVAASAIAMSKLLGKRMAASAGVPCAPDEVFEGDALAGAKPPAFGFPLVVKPDREGSTVGITIVRGEGQWEAAMAEAARHDSRVLVEGFVPGREITVGIVNGRVLPAIEIVPKSGFYDYHSKYTAGQTEYVIPVPMDRDILLRAAEYTRRAARAMQLRGAARLDYRIDPAGNVFFLEANTIPGMTETSLLPKAAKFDGLPFDDLVLEILSDAGLSK